MELSKIQAEIDAAAPGAVIRVAAGTYTGTLNVTKGVTLLGTGAVVFDAQHRDSVVLVNAPGALVKLAGLTLVNGSAADAGGGVSLINGSLELLQCTVKQCKAPNYGGGAVFLAGEKATISQCRFEGNTSRQGGAILCDQVVVVELKHSLLVQNAAVQGGAIHAKEGAKVLVQGCTLADNRAVGELARGSAVYVAGSTTLAPEVELSHCVVGERGAGPTCLQAGPPSGKLNVKFTLLPESEKARAAGNVIGVPEFAGRGSEPYALTAKSPGVGAGDATTFTAQDKDLVGKKRLSDGNKPDLGALALG